MLRVLVSVHRVWLVLTCARERSASTKNVEAWTQMVIVGWLHLYAIAKSLLIDSRLQLSLFFFELWLVLLCHHVHNIFPELLLITSLCIFVGRIRLLNRRVSVKCLFPLFLGNVWHYNVFKSWDLSTACEDGLDLSVNLLPVTLTFFLNLQNFVAIQISALNCFRVFSLELLDNQVFVFELSLQQFKLVPVFGLITSDLFFDLLHSMPWLSQLLTQLTVLVSNELHFSLQQRDFVFKNNVVSIWSYVSCLCIEFKFLIGGLIWRRLEMWFCIPNFSGNNLFLLSLLNQDWHSNKISPLFMHLRLLMSVTWHISDFRPRIFIFNSHRVKPSQESIFILLVLVLWHFQHRLFLNCVLLKVDGRFKSLTFFKAWHL